MLLITIACIISIANSFLWGSGFETGPTGWNTLKTTWNIIPWKGFFGVPLTRSDAESGDYTQIMWCGDAGSPGNVYWTDNDLSAMPFYNADGYIAGIIIGVENPGYTEIHNDHYTSLFVEYSSFSTGTFYGVTGYFRNPEQVCTEGTTDNIEIGEGLWLANGDGEGDYYKPPLTQDNDQLETDGFTEGGCFSTMGTHYWRYMSTDMSCDNAYPLFLLYNGGVLNAWGIAMAHSDRGTTPGDKWEHPGGDVLAAFFQDGDMPLCLPEMGLLNTMHIYMNNPLSMLCSIESHIDNKQEIMVNDDALLSSNSAGFTYANHMHCIVGALVVFIIVIMAAFGYRKCRNMKGKDLYSHINDSVSYGATANNQV